ncbi:hypothetical protein [Nakamurella panacisegetis]|nr:hypothetical protein [Nakamurella panacisegetis]
MGRVDWRAVISGLDVGELQRLLGSESGLPGPRANLALADAFAAVGPDSAIDRFADDPDEYLRFCGTQGLGRLLLQTPDDLELRARLRTRASDDLWRVREGAARALQDIGTQNATLMRELVGQWLESEDPLVLRAAVAAVCEPRLLTDDDNARLALHACRVATAALVRLRDTVGADDRLRVLRQALAYCCSVAIAADPAHGAADLEWLQASDDRDIAWIAASNLEKARLRPLLAAAPARRPRASDGTPPPGRHS